MKEARKLWTKDELIPALNLYLKLPFSKLHSSNTQIIHLAKIIGRTAGSVARRLNNFASVDPYHQQRGIGGLPGGRKQVEPIWNEFTNNKCELRIKNSVASVVPLLYGRCARQKNPQLQYEPHKGKEYKA